MRITKTEIKNHIEEKDPIATYYGGLAGLGVEIYEIDDAEETIYFVEIAWERRTPKKSKIFINKDGKAGFRWGNWIVWLDECLRTNW